MASFDIETEKLIFWIIFSIDDLYLLFYDPLKIA